MTDRHPFEPEALLAEEVEPGMSFLLYSQESSTPIYTGTFTSAVQADGRFTYRLTTFLSDESDEIGYAVSFGMTPGLDKKWSECYMLRGIRM